MKDYDVVLLTDSRYVNPIKSNDYIENVDSDSFNSSNSLIV